MTVLLENVRRRKVHRVQNNIFIILPPTLQMFSWLMITAFVITLGYLSVAEFAKKETVQGVLQSASDPVNVYPGGPGTVSDIFVRDGQWVSKGTPLLKLTNPTFVDGQKLHSEAQQVEQLQATIVEKERLLAAWPAQHQANLSELAEKIKNTNAELSAIAIQQETAQGRLVLAETQLKRLSSIEIDGYISALEVNRQRDSVLVLRQQLEELTRARLQAQSALLSYEGESERAGFVDQDTRQKLAEEIRALQLQVNAVQQKIDTVMVAPVDGLVDNVQFKKGQSVLPTQVAMAVVPKRSALTLTLYAPATSAVFIKPGQRVKVRYKNFPYQRFGSYSGQVSRVGSAAVMPADVSDKIQLTQPAYEVDVLVDTQEVNSYGRTFELKSGMMAEVDVITEQRTLLYWLFEPLLALYKK